MLKDKLLVMAFLASLITHGVILFQNPNLNFLLSPVNKDMKIEVSYIKQAKETGQGFSKSANQEPFLRMDRKIVADNRVTAPFPDREDIFKGAKTMSPRTADFTKPALSGADIISVRKKITLPAIGLDKINNPSYISYYQIVREKIKRAAYQNYTRQDTGEVYLSFVANSDGSLQDERVVEEKSSPVKYLQQIALRSLKDATPFPVFPKELNYPSLSFNVVISFEIE